MNTLHVCFNWDSNCQPGHKILHASVTVAIATLLLRWINEAFRHFPFHEVCCDDCGVFPYAIIAKLPSQLVTFYREHKGTYRLSTHSGRRTRAGCLDETWLITLGGKIDHGRYELRCLYSASNKPPSFFFHFFYLYITHMIVSKIFLFFSPLQLTNQKNCC